MRPPLPPTICFDCQNATASLCNWIAQGDMDNIIEYQARKAAHTSKQLISVQKCKKFKEGPLVKTKPVVTNPYLKVASTI